MIVLIVETSNWSHAEELTALVRNDSDSLILVSMLGEITERAITISSSIVFAPWSALSSRKTFLFSTDLCFPTLSRTSFIVASSGFLLASTFTESRSKSPGVSSSKQNDLLKQNRTISERATDHSGPDRTQSCIETDHLYYATVSTTNNTKRMQLRNISVSRVW